MRSTFAELAELGLVTKAHASAGRFPTEEGLRYVVRHLLGPRRLGHDEMRDLAAHVEDGDPQQVLRSVSRLLSERTISINTAASGGNASLLSLME